MKLKADQFEKLALEQIDTLFRVAKRLTRDAERAGDLVQETYLRAFGRGCCGLCRTCISADRRGKAASRWRWNPMHWKPWRRPRASRSING